MDPTPNTAASYAASRLRALMAARKPQLKAPHLAKVLGCSPQSAARRMSGATPLDLEDLVRVADWLGQPPEHFIPEHKQPARVGR